MIGVSDEYVALQITSSQNQGRIKQLFVLYIISYITINIYICVCLLLRVLLGHHSPFHLDRSCQDW